MPSLRRHQRIRPARARLSGRRVAVSTVAGVLVLAVLVTSMAGRRQRGSVELDESQAYRLASSAGPVEIVAGPVAQLDYRASWLGWGPTVGRGGSTVPEADRPAVVTAIEVSIGCETRWPCRASARLQAPADVGLEANTTGGPVTIGWRTGPVVVSTTGDDDVFIGPTEGDVTVVTEQGNVIGTGLAAPVVEIRTDHGEVELRFRERPRSVVVEAGTAPVTIELPPGPYAVSVEGSPTATVEVERDDLADSRVSVGGLGTVRITQFPDEQET